MLLATAALDLPNDLPRSSCVRLNSFCSYRPPEQTGKNVFAYQWMTQKHLDGAFKDLDIDSQIQKIEGVSAVRLPEVYKGS